MYTYSERICYWSVAYYYSILGPMKVEKKIGAGGGGGAEITTISIEENCANFVAFFCGICVSLML